MKYEYMVKYDGVYYASGEEVPDEAKKPVEPPTAPVDNEEASDNDETKKPGRKPKAAGQ